MDIRPIAMMHRRNQSYDAPQEPAPYAYGSQVQNHAGQAPHHTHNNGYQAVPQLRGAYGASSRQAYKYGNLGAVAYDIGSDIRRCGL